MKNYLKILEMVKALEQIDFNNMPLQGMLILEDVFNSIDELTSNRLDTWFIPKNFVMGAGLTLGYKTMFGPIEIELSRSNIVDRWSLFVNVGYWF